MPMQSHARLYARDVAARDQIEKCCHVSLTCFSIGHLGRWVWVTAVLGETPELLLATRSQTNMQQLFYSRLQNSVVMLRTASCRDLGKLTVFCSSVLGQGLWPCGEVMRRNSLGFYSFFMYVAGDLILFTSHPQLLTYNYFPPNCCTIIVLYYVLLRHVMLQKTNPVLICDLFSH